MKHRDDLLEYAASCIEGGCDAISSVRQAAVHFYVVLTDTQVESLAVDAMAIAMWDSGE